MYSKVDKSQAASPKHTIAIIKRGLNGRESWPTYMFVRQLPSSSINFPQSSQAGHNEFRTTPMNL